MALQRLGRTWAPAVFQGRLAFEHYFEGWYFKAVALRCEEAVAVIPGCR